MKIKSLLLGSAAASMLAVSGAQAADPIIYAEPEPMEYVRICDVYGAGYYYIPGTETCLRIGGWVRYQMQAGNAFADVEDADGNVIGNRSNQNWNKTSEFNVTLDARSETEWGTLRGLIVIESAGSNLGRGTNTFGVTATHAVIQLGGLFMGFGDSYFIQSAGVLGAPVGNYGTHSAPNGSLGGYSFQRSQMIGYHYMSPEGFYAGLALEHNPALGNPPGYMPNVVGRLAYAQAWGGIYGVGAYDSAAEGWGGRLGVELNVPNAPGSQLRVYGLYRSNNQVQYGPGTATGAGTNAQWGIVASYNHNFGSGFSAGLAYQHNRSFNDVGTNFGQIFASYTPVSQFHIRGDVTRNFDADTWTGSLRFQRDF